MGSLLYSSLTELFVKRQSAQSEINNSQWRTKVCTKLTAKIWLYSPIIHYIAKSIGTPSNERFDYFSNLHEYTS